MKRFGLTSILLVGSVLAPTTGSAQISCAREGLKRAVDLYIAAQITGDTGLPLAAGLGYTENIAAADINTGLIKRPIKIDHHRSLLHPSTCQTFTEVIVTDKEQPHALATRKKDLVPWGYPCNRTEGGAHTGNGSPTDSCDVGVPSGVNIANRRFIVDETIGSVAVFCTFGAGGPSGGSGAPDTHLFRVENGQLRYVHTLTHLLQPNFRGRGAGGRAGGAGGEAAPKTQR
jgi:hypothetical protein